LSESIETGTATLSEVSSVALPQGPFLEQLVTYYGIDEGGVPKLRRYFPYKIITSPGPSEGSGMATILTPALRNPEEVCEDCQKVHTVEQGGAAAALTSAMDYLDAYHNGDRLRKVMSDIRGWYGDRTPTIHRGRVGTAY
jgi:hypothetical protein